MSTATLSIVVAEDNEILRRYIYALSKKSGKFTIVAEAFDGAEAVRLIIDEQPDMVLMDIGMPKLNGIDAVRELRRLGCHTPVLIFSSLDDCTKVAEALAAGADGYLMKTANPDDVVQAIDDVANGRGVYLEDKVAALLHAMCERNLQEDEAATPR